MNSWLLRFSLGLNLVLLGMTGYWASHVGRDRSPATGQISQTSRPVEESAGPMATAPTVPPSPAPLHWSELESEDYPTYVANLRRAGCPEVVLHRIIGADLQELYARKGFALVQEFHRDFWEIAARENIRDYFGKTLQPQIQALSQEPGALLRQLAGEAPRDLSGASAADAAEGQFTDFLSPARHQELRRLEERYAARRQAVRQANLSPEEKASRLEQLRGEMEGEQARLFSPEEWAEYQLRQSAAASELRELYGVDFSETELRHLAKAIDDYHRLAASQTETDAATLEQELRAVLGPARFADLERARSASYRELYEAAADFGQPREIAAELFDLRLQSETQSEEIRADKNRSAGEKQALLDDLQERVEQTALTRFGAGAYQRYKAKDGRWINALGRL